MEMKTIKVLESSVDGLNMLSAIHKKKQYEIVEAIVKIALQNPMLIADEKEPGKVNSKPKKDQPALPAVDSKETKVQDLTKDAAIGKPFKPGLSKYLLDRQKLKQ